MNRLELINKKIEEKEKLTLEEWQCCNLNTCSSMRDAYFPKYCQEQGLDLSSVFTFSIWQAVWNKAMEDHEENRIDKLSNAQYAVTLKLRTYQQKWRAPEIKQKIEEIFSKNCPDWIFEEDDLSVKFVKLLS
jgi:hypothetical protein